MSCRCFETVRVCLWLNPGVRTHSQARPMYPQLRTFGAEWSNKRFVTDRLTPNSCIQPVSHPAGWCRIARCKSHRLTEHLGQKSPSRHPSPSIAPEEYEGKIVLGPPFVTRGRLCRSLCRLRPNSGRDLAWSGGGQFTSLSPFSTHLDICPRVSARC